MSLPSSGFALFGTALVPATHQPAHSQYLGQVVVPLPDEVSRAAILGVHLRRVPLASKHDRDLACEAVAKITAGMCGVGWTAGSDSLLYEVGKCCSAVTLPTVSHSHHTL